MKSFTDKDAFKLHKRRSHKGEFSHMCIYCEATFPRQKYLNQHMSENHTEYHPNKIDYVCIICKISFKDKKLLNEHLISHDGPGINFSCDICKRNFNTVKEYILHYPGHKRKGKKAVLCDLCGQAFKFHNHLIKHLNAHHKMKRYPCDVCSRVLSTKETLKLHMQRHQGIVKWNCNVCHAGFLTRPSFITHQQTHDETRDPKKLFSCDECPKVFRSKHSLQLHMDSVHRGITHKCDHCGKCYKSKFQLRTHIREFHEQDFTYVCNVCKKGFTKSREYKNHIMIHANKKDYICPHCRKRFTLKPNLSHHIRSVHEKVTYSCRYPQCDKSFASKMNLKYHMEEHCGNFKHICSFCNKGFWRLSDFKKHINTHTKESTVLL